MGCQGTLPVCCDFLERNRLEAEGFIQGVVTKRGAGTVMNWSEAEIMRLIDILRTQHR